MSHTPVPPIEGYASYLAAICIMNGAENQTMQPLEQLAQTASTVGGTWVALSTGEGPGSLQMLKSLDDLDEETDEDADDVDADDEDDEDDDEDEDDDLDDETDEDEDEVDADDEDEDDDDEDEEEEDEDGGVKPLKMAPRSAASRLQ